VDNAAAACVDQPIAEGLGDETALVTPARRVTYAELSTLVDRAGDALRARGVEPEQRVALLLPDGIGFAAAFFAAIKIGAVAGPLNTRLASGDLHAILSDCRPKVLVADPDAAQAGYRAFKKYFQGVQPGRTAVEAAPPRKGVNVEIGAIAFWP
jgi:acyl-CoA synthetase (AMP-forming)/AMP-acid ligase II